MRKGYLVIEVLLAAALFVTFATGAIVAVISSGDTNRRAAEQTAAMGYLSEGLEAARSIKNQGFANLLPTPSLGVARSAGGVWSFSGTSNSTDSGRYTRVISVADVNRDGSGNIVLTGTPDPNTKKVTSGVSWNFTAARPQDLSVSTYMTNWRAAIGASDNALLAYGDGITAPTNEPRYRLYTNSSNTFGTETSTALAGAIARNVVTRTSPTKREAIVAYGDNVGTLRVLCFDGSTWSADWSATIGGTGTTRRFDIAYETTSGDVVVAYSTNAATTNEMAYRTKLGSTGCGSANWAAATNIDAVRTAGIVQWVRLGGSVASGSNNIALAWADAASDLSATIWTGSGWTIAEPAAALETSLEFATAAQDVESFDLAFESTSGNLMIVWGLFQATTCTAGTTIATTNCIRYARYTTSWSAVAVIPTVADPATNIDISANPNTNELLTAALDNSAADLSIAYWSGSVWTGKANHDTSTRVAAAGTKLVRTAWLISGATTRKIVVYNDSTATNVGWVVCTTGATCTTQTDWVPTPIFANPQSWYDVQMDPLNKDRLMFGLSDNATDLFAKRLVMDATPAFTWTNADGGAAMELTLGRATAQPFSFAYWRL
ncbi:MAG: Uncharacterized protein G01um101416_824 [Microgenomates group bacterium Gr01-1014_16]|nr:MAG: Uncharacterized protein G01um101416_824 [Microgenomates group bacterium Gr01-1014_16]